MSVATQFQVKGVDENFIPLSIKGMKNLEEAGRSNMIYSLIRCVSLPDSAGNPTRLDLKRMPTGYMEHQLNFFNASHYFNVLLHVTVNLYVHHLVECSCTVVSGS